MRARADQTAPPGLGVRPDMMPESGRRLGSVSHRYRPRDLVRSDLDGTAADIPPTDDEAAAPAGILGASLI
ncbi:hypothetical protein QQG74_00680 [Micromonospora sp. FIMYZ51]|uniref:hypothetical protein n=1 Tax=Micromonospora sp. FIMYZ51 TaxID=3051832 RepID=UPI00311E8DF5